MGEGWWVLGGRFSEDAGLMGAESDAGVDGSAEFSAQKARSVCFMVDSGG